MIFKLVLFVFAIAISFLPGIFGMIFTPGTGKNLEFVMEFANLLGIQSPGTAVDIWYYTAIRHPSFTPPAWVFGAAWSTLYFLIGVAFFLALITKDETGYSKKRSAIVFFFLHLILNGAWSWVFFGKHLMVIALVVLMALLFVSIYMWMGFKRQNKWAGYLVIPYLLWLCFATALNAGFIYLNLL